LGRTQAANLLGVELVNQRKPDSITKAKQGTDYLEFQLNLTVVTRRPLASQLIIGVWKRDYTSLLAHAKAVP
jgi:predicted lysophospholipase L1 biosynthesis ABC-type transport system permease subunit